MQLRNNYKDKIKQSESEGRVYYQHQSFAATAVNALEQRTLLDIESEP